LRLIFLALTDFVVAACKADVTVAKSLKMHNRIFDEASRAAFGCDHRFGHQTERCETEKWEFSFFCLTSFCLVGLEWPKRRSQPPPLGATVKPLF
jgi:hypothetical protein